MQESHSTIATPSVHPRLMAQGCCAELIQSPNRSATESERRTAMEEYSQVNSAIEKFTSTDLSSLREELLQSGLVSFHAAELIRSFRTIRGYGVSNQAARG